MRLPSPGRERDQDNVWIPRVGAIYHRAMEEADDYSRNEVVIGEPCRITGPGIGEWWMTSTVMAVEKVDIANTPNDGQRYLIEGAGVPISATEVSYFADLPKGSLPQADVPYADGE